MQGATNIAIASPSIIVVIPTIITDYTSQENNSKPASIQIQYLSGINLKIKSEEVEEYAKNTQVNNNNKNSMVSCNISHMDMEQSKQD